MKKLYKKGKVVDAEDEQISTMKSAGWSEKKPALKPEVENSKAKIPKKIPTRKAIKKTDKE